MNPNMPGNPYAGHQPHTEAGGIISALDTLSFEQRTANLIAFYNQIDKPHDAASQELHEQIVRRLGLRDE